MKLFISHSELDSKFAVRLAADLRNEGCDVWLDKWEISPGDKLVERIEEGLAGAEVFLLLLSPESVVSPWVDYERQAWLAMQIADERTARAERRSPRRTLIPVLYRDSEIPTFLQAIRYVRINDEQYLSLIHI